MLRAVLLTQYRRVTGQTDGQTDGIAVANTALAMRALRRAVKKTRNRKHHRTAATPAACAEPLML